LKLQPAQAHPRLGNAISRSREMKVFLSLLLALAAMLPAYAQQPYATGEVKRINERRKEITVAHGPIPQLAMDAMTMAFPVKDAKLLKRVKVGDKVRFQAEMVGKEAIITSIEVIK
jgi:Cu/Ag efflux protein CusF